MVTTKTWLQAGAGVVVAALITAAFLQGRAAQDAWTANDPAGECGEASFGGEAGRTGGGEVLAAQNVLSATHGLSPIDGTWNADTDDAVRSFQAWTGLPVDGCVNTNTWVTMRALLVSACDPAYQCQGPDHLLRWGPAREGRDAWFLDANCDWASWVQPGVAESPLASQTAYGFSDDPVRELRCEG